MNAIFLGGRQAGLIGLLTLKSMDCPVISAVCYDENLKSTADKLGITTYPSIHAVPSWNTDIIVSVHGREIVPKEIFSVPRQGAINAHPCLYKYPGKNPIRRFLKDHETLASVGIHRMTTMLDEGEVIKEIFINVAGKNTVDEVYNALYPVYSIALMESMTILARYK